MQSFDTIDRLRLDVELPPEPGQLRNLIRNPSGELGGWGWLSPVANTVVSTFGDGAQLMARTTVAQAVYVTSESMKVTPGQYVAGRLTFGASLVSHVRLRFVFLDAAGAVLSLGAQTGYIAASVNGANAQLPPALVPAGAAYAQLRIDLYSSNAGANPLANTYLLFRSVTVASSTSSAGLGSSRTNLCTNPSFETNLTGWGAAYSGTIAIDRTNAWAAVGSYSRRMTMTGASSTMYAEQLTPSIACEAGKQYAVSATLRVSANAAASGWFYLGAEWTNSSGSVFSTTLTWQTAKVTSAGGVRFGNVLTAPAGAVSVRFRFRCSSMSNGEAFYLDGCLIEESGASLASYFDGSTPDAGGIDYSWAGTAHGSASTAIEAGGLAYIPPIQYLSILGTAHAIAIGRTPLDANEAKVEMRDADLDPAQSDVIRPGRACRMCVLDPSTGVWHPLFTGAVSRAEVQYELLQPKAEKRARIALSANDNGTELASVPRPEGVATIAELPHVLEGAGVPWSVNGSGDQVTGAVVVATNDSASAIDQIALTRDSTLGAAWVDRSNVLQAWDAKQLPGAALTNDAPAALGSGAVITTGIEYAGRKWSRVAASTDLHGVRQNVALAELIDGAAYQAEWLVANDGPAPVTVAVDWTDLNQTFVTIQPGELRTVRSSGTRADYTSSLRFTDLVLQSAGTSILFAPAAVRAVSGIAATLTEADYSDLQIDYDTQRAINHVTIKFLRTSPASGETEEVTYGPYVDQASIDEWGTLAATFTIQWQDENEAAIAAHAAAILAANSRPARRVNSLTIPIRTDAAFAAAAGQRRALLDLLDAVIVQNADAGVNETLRVESITHTIRARSWVLELGFVREGQVASPRPVPAPSGGANGLTLSQLLRPVGEVTMFYGPAAPAGWLECNGTAIPAEYAELIALVGPNTPDLNDRFVVGASASKAVGSTGGASSYELASHQHNGSGLSTGAAQGMADQTAASGAAVNLVTRASANSHTHNVSGQTGNSGAATIPTLPPYRALRYIIRAR